MIKEFRNDYFFLSNMYICDIKFGNKKFYSVEHAYQWTKCNNPDWRKFCIETTNPKFVKIKSKSIRPSKTFLKYRTKIMKKLVFLKFDNYPLNEMLLKTGDEYIEEGNYWHDNYWGNCYCNKCLNIKGKNILGKIIMKKRNFLEKNGLQYK